MRLRERERGRDTGREKQAPCRKPDVELDPGTPGSRPGPKAGAKPLSHPGIPHLISLTPNSCLSVAPTIKNIYYKEDHNKSLSDSGSALDF